LYNTTAAAEDKSVILIWSFEEKFFGCCGLFCFYHSCVLVDQLIKFSLSDKIAIYKSQFSID
jgi:hypothetical protein